MRHAARAASSLRNQDSTMATISSPGIASGLDVKGIVSQLTALERAPLRSLQTQASSLQAKLSVFGSIKSATSALGDAAAKLADVANWQGVKASSSNTTTATVSAASNTTPMRFALQVTSLATAQSAVSDVLNTTSGLGTGSLKFTTAGGTETTIDIGAGEDTPAQVAAKINAQANLDVSATVLKDANGERLLLTSKSTGAANTFTVEVTGGNADGLQKLGFSSAPGSAMTQAQAGTNAQFSVNGVALESATNTVKDTVPGVTLNLLTTGTSNIDISTDSDAIKKNLQAFVDAYNSLNNLLTTTTKYDPATKTAGSLQGDSTARGLQTAMRSMMQSVTPGGEFTRLSDIGITALQGGNLQINSSKLDAALGSKLGELQKLFADDKGTPTEDGFGLKVKNFAKGLTDGALSSRQDGLQAALTRNSKEQDRVNDRATRAEARYLAQYNAMDAAVGQLNALNAYVAQQVTMWNKSTG